MYAQVIVDIASEAGAHTYTYRIPEGMELCPGYRVQVPFGRQTKEGVVLKVEEQSDYPPEKTKEIKAPLEDYPAILPWLLELAGEMAGVNHCPLAETLRLMIPPDMRRQQVSVRTRRFFQLDIPREKVAEERDKLGKKTRCRMILDLLSDGAGHDMEEIRTLVRDPGPHLKELKERKLIRETREEWLRTPEGLSRSAEDDGPELTPDQEEVIGQVLPSLKKGEGRFLLHGVTGSGKTEVFMRLVQHVLDAGRSALILVPEIALTPQMVAWFGRRFGEAAAVIHSRLGRGERFDEWRRIRRGEARVVIGARSAVFSPLTNLGLIVIDEEHEQSYLSDRHPRYDVRDVALSRAMREHATLLLASATPSMLSFAKARKGLYTLLEMPSRIGGRPLPEVTVVDMRRELEKGNRSMFSLPLQKALRTCVEQGHQAMLLMNHRGYYSFVSCRRCGEPVKCRNCDVSLTYHFGGGEALLHCHYCGYTARVPRVCPACGSDRIRYFGAGTQKVEDEVRHMFPGLSVGRMDMDTTRGKSGHAGILEKFRSGETRILVGTQMIAKGLDFPQVTLVGVLAADMTLHFPDYRARERTFQLLTQVSGRAGRGETPGQVVVQTYQPENEVIQLSARQDYRSFYESEISRRRTAMYPPFTVMVRLLVESGKAERAEAQARRLAERVGSILDAHPEWAAIRLLFTVEQPPLTMIRGRFRWHVLFKLRAGSEAERLCGVLSGLAEERQEDCDVYYEYNPSAMM